MIQCPYCDWKCKKWYTKKGKHISGENQYWGHLNDKHSQQRNEYLQRQKLEEILDEFGNTYNQREYLKNAINFETEK